MTFLIFKWRKKKSPWISFIDERICAKKVHPWDIRGQEALQKRYGSPAPVVGKNLCRFRSSPVLLQRKRCVPFSWMRLINSTMELVPCKESMEIVSTCNTEPSRKTWSTKKLVFLFLLQFGVSSIFWKDTCSKLDKGMANCLAAFRH